jgi:transglutaminase-like putative cysteine protease
MTVERVTRAALAGAATGAFAHLQETPLAWVFLAPIALTSFRRFDRLPALLVSGARTATWMLLALVFLVRWLGIGFPLLPADAVAILSSLLGWALSGLTMCFLLCPRRFAAEWTFYPAVLGTFAVATLQPEGWSWPFLLVAGVAVFVELLWANPRPFREPTAAVVLAAGQLAWVVVIAGTVIELLPTAQTRVEEVIVGVYSPKVGQAGLSPHSRLGELEQLKLSRRVVMRVWSERAQKLRAHVLARFDGRIWSPGESRLRVLPPGEPEPYWNEAARAWNEGLSGLLFVAPDARAELNQGVLTRVLQKGFAPNALLVPRGVLAVRGPLDEIRFDRKGAFLGRPASSARLYGVIHRRELGMGPSTEGPEPDDLEVAADTDPRLRALAARLTATASSPADRILRTVSFVQGAARYSLEVGRFSSSQPVAEFLFEKKRGYCEYFASAAAVLLRLQGVPARYVTGFNVLESNKLGGHYVVRESDAHAWIDAHLPGQGWLELDPTPPAEYEALHAGVEGGAFRELLEELKGWVSTLVAQLRDRSWRSLLGLAADVMKKPIVGFPLLLLVAVVAALELRRRAGARARGDARGRTIHAMGPELSAALALVDLWWKRHGFPRPPSRPPLEHLATIQELGIPVDVRASARLIIDTAYRALFRADRLSEEEFASLETACQKLRR